MSKFINAQIIIIYLKIDTRMKTFFNFMERVLLYQILIFGSLGKFYNILNSQREFIHKLKVLYSDLNLSKNSLSYMSLPEDDDTFFRIVLISIITFSVLSILNINFMQLISGIISIIIGFIYFNPFTKINELIASQNSAVDAMKKATEVMEKSAKIMEKSVEKMEKLLQNQDILIQYILQVVKKNQEEEEKKKEEENKKLEAEKKK